MSRPFVPDAQQTPLERLLLCKFIRTGCLKITHQPSLVCNRFKSWFWDVLHRGLYLIEDTGCLWNSIRLSNHAAAANLFWPLHICRTVCLCAAGVCLFAQASAYMQSRRFTCSRRCPFAAGSAYKQNGAAHLFCPLHMCRAVCLCAAARVYLHKRLHIYRAACLCAVGAAHLQPALHINKRRCQFVLAGPCRVS